MVSVEVSFLITAVVSTGIRRLTSAARKNNTKENESSFDPISSFSSQSARRPVGNQKKSRIGRKNNNMDKPIENQLTR